jgi:pyruvate/2-oxoglutarate dehydrogenase complex dihydrolipoamide dehydrogenase (E3) component
VWTNRQAVLPKELPGSLVVIGSGAVGAELAQAFARLGTRVHVLEAADRILAGEEPEASAALARYFKVEGIEVTTSAKAARVDRDGSGIKVTLAGGDTVSAERLLVATGRSPNLEGFDLEAAGLQATERGFLKVDPATLSAGDGVFGAGDVTGLGGFTHLAYYHGTVIAKRLKGQDVKANHSAIPRVTFTDPEIASVGMGEKQARAAGMDVRTAAVEVANSARGAIHGEPGGVIKLVADQGRKLLVGATVVSPRAGEMLSELTLAVRARVPLSVMDDLLHPFPTFSRILQGAFAELV